MTFYFGFAAKRRCYLAVDRRRTDEFGEANDSTPKLVKVNRFTYLAGAGLMHFTDQVAEVAPAAFGTSRLTWSDLERACKRWSDQLSIAFEQMIRAAPNLDHTNSARLQFCGVTSDSGPFSFAWNSDVGYESLVRDAFRFYMPIFNSRAKSAELQNRISKIARIAEEGKPRAEILASTAELFAWVAAQDETVSQTADIAIIGRWLSNIFDVGER